MSYGKSLTKLTTSSLIWELLENQFYKWKFGRTVVFSCSLTKQFTLISAPNPFQSKVNFKVEQPFNSHLENS